MKKKNIMLLTFNIIVWICCITSISIRPFSSIASWILLGIEYAFVVGILIIVILGCIQLKKEEKELERKLEEDRKRLEELINGYLVASLKEDNKEDVEV